MSKFHISPATGDPKECRAIYSCPFGDESDHFASADEAREAYESRMSDENFAVHEKTGFFDVVDPSLLEELESSHYSLNYQNFVAERDSREYDSEVWRGREITTPGYGMGTVELWIGNDTVSGWINVGDNDVKKFSQAYSGEFTDSMRAAAFGHLFDEAKNELPEIFDAESELYTKRLEVEEQVRSGSVQVGDFTLRNQGGVAPQIWEIEDGGTDTVADVYVRVRHEWASGRVTKRNGDTEVIHSSEAKHWFDGDASKALFFMRFNDELLRWEANSA